MTHPSPVSTIHRWLPVVVWSGLILGASSIPAADLPDVGFRVNDKLVHGLEYLVLAVIAVRQLSLPSAGSDRSILVSVALLGSLLGAVDETYQRLIPGRESTWGDWTADVTGTLLGIAIAFWLIRIRPSIVGRASEGETR